jgi:hypothetical protein
LDFLDGGRKRKVKLGFCLLLITVAPLLRAGSARDFVREKLQSPEKAYLSGDGILDLLASKSEEFLGLTLTSFCPVRIGIGDPPR